MKLLERMRDVGIRRHLAKVTIECSGQRGAPGDARRQPKRRALLVAPHPIRQIRLPPPLNRERPTPRPVGRNRRREGPAGRFRFPPKKRRKSPRRRRRSFAKPRLWKLIREKNLADL